MKINRIKLSTALMGKEWTLQMLADKSGVSRGTISSARNGKTCSDTSAIKIANALGVELSDLLED